MTAGEKNAGLDDDERALTCPLLLLHPLYLAELWINNDVGGEAGRGEQEKRVAKGNKHTLAEWRERRPRPGFGTWVLGYVGTGIHGYLQICGRVKRWQGWKRGKTNRRKMKKGGSRDGRGMEGWWARPGWGSPLAVETKSRSTMQVSEPDPRASRNRHAA